ncbi:MFS transporter [Enterococcus casseliflavus]|uniref:MFS transporter n=1 Tax=Enterococcus casseliflavus TaxID=37734 RepID=UPI0039A443A2
MNGIQAGKKLDQLPISKWHWQTFFLIGFGLQINGFLNSSGSSILADLVDRGWSNNYFNAMFSSAMMAGFFLGSLLGGMLGDKYGRKKAYQASILCFSLFSLLAALSINMWFLIFCRGAMGVGMGAGIVVGYASFTEFLPAKVRGSWSARLSLIGNFSPLIAAMVSFLVIPTFGWRWVFIIGGVASIISLIFVSVYLDESPRWCFENGQSDQGEQIINKVISKIEKEKDISFSFDQGSKNVCEHDQQKIPFKAFFKGDLGVRTIIASTVLIAMNISLYTITVWIPTIFVNSGIDISRSLLMTTLIMIGAPLGVFASTLLMDKFPRKWFGVVLISLIAILGYVYSVQTEESRIIVLGSVLIFVLYIFNSFSSAVYAPEIWPTKVKMRGAGISNSIGRIVAIVTPFVIAWLLTNYGVQAVFIVLGCTLGLCALILALFGIETRKKSIEEIESNFFKEAKDKYLTLNEIRESKEKNL